MLSLVGSSASTFMGFIFPALVVVATQRKPNWRHAAKRGLAWGLVGLGGALFVNGFVVPFLQ